MVNATDVNFYAKLIFAVILLIIVIRNVYKTIDGNKKGKRIITPAMVVIYFLFAAGSVMAVVMVVIERVIEQEFDAGKSAAEIQHLIVIDYFIQEVYETFYWGAQAALVHKYVVTAFEMPQFFTLYQIKLEGKSMVSAAETQDDAMFERMDTVHKVLTNKASSDWKMWLSLVATYTGFAVLTISNGFILVRVARSPNFEQS